MKRLMVLLAALLWAAVGCQTTPDKTMVLLPVEDDPTISFRLMFKVGSQNDPAGKEGLASITASMISDAASENYAYEDILERLYPMASSISSQVDKEMTVIYGRAHKDNLDDYYTLLKDVVLNPAFDEADFDRVKKNQLSYVERSLRYSQDEELGKEVLYSFIFEGTPYAHNEEGTVAGINAITLDDVRNFYQQHYTRANLVIGLGGGFAMDFPEMVKADLAALPEGTPSTVPASQPAPIEGTEVKIVSKNAASTAISFGFPIEPVRGQRDFYALAIATSWLGEHRNSFSHLFEVIREKRGLNYGDYAYVEHFPNGGSRQFPPPNVARRQQIFQIWIRPVPNTATAFSFRAAVRELDKLVNQGMSQEDFDLTRKFLSNYILHYAPTTMMKLGYALDDRFYGIPTDHWKRYGEMLREITRDEVNAALKTHFSATNMKAVFVTDAGEVDALTTTLVENTPSPISYESPKPDEILEEDKAISTYPLSVSADAVTVVPVDSVFQN